MENYRNKMPRILNEMAAAGRCLNRFFDRKSVHQFSILNSAFSIVLILLMIGLIFYDLKRPVNLFQQHDAVQLVGEGHL